MIDQIISRKGLPGEDKILADYKPDLAITSVRLLNESSDKLTVIFPPWHGAGDFIRKLENKLVDNGWAVLSYDMHDHILEPNVDGVIATYRYIQDTITQQVNDLQDRKHYSQVHLLSISLGIVSLMPVAARLKFFSRASIVLGASSLSGCVWHGIRTQRIRKAFEDQGVDLTTLQNKWAKIEPSFNAMALSGKDVHLYISNTDRITPLNYAQELSRDLSAAGAFISEKRLRLGHALSIIKFCLLPPGKL